MSETDRSNINKTLSRRAPRKGVVLALAAIGVLLVSAFISGCRLGVNEPPRLVHKGAGAPFDLQGFIDTALASGQKRIVVAPGRYRVKPQGQCHLRLRDLQDVEIVATDVEMVCAETTLALSIDNCRKPVELGREKADCDRDRSVQPGRGAAGSEQHTMIKEMLQ